MPQKQSAIVKVVSAGAWSSQRRIWKHLLWIWLDLILSGWWRWEPRDPLLCLGMRLATTKRRLRHQPNNKRWTDYANISAISDIQTEVVWWAARHIQEDLRSEQTNQVLLRVWNHAKDLQSLHAHESANENKLRSMSVIQNNSGDLFVRDFEDLRTAVQAQLDSKSVPSAHKKASAWHEVFVP